MKILIIEDDLNKGRQLTGFLKQVVPGSIIRQARSYQSGLENIFEDAPDLVLLDMTLPTFDVSPTEAGWRTRPLGGMEVLSELHRMEVKCATIVVTQFESFGEGDDIVTLDELERRLGAEYSQLYLGVVAYQPSESGWREGLERLVRVAVNRYEEDLRLKRVRTN